MLFIRGMKTLGSFDQNKQVFSSKALYWTCAPWLWCSWSVLGYIKCNRDEFEVKMMMFRFIH